jgi:ATP-dependent DNA ligase
MRGSSNLHYAVFDVLWLKGKDLRDGPLSRRKRILSKLVNRTTPSSHLSSEKPTSISTVCHVGADASPCS